MKKVFFTIHSILLLSISATAQDLITKRNGEDIYSKVLEVGPGEIKYKKFDNLEGPTIIIFTSDVLMIRYENGTKDIFTQDEYQSSDQQQTAVSKKDLPPGIQPYMPYKAYKDKYNTRMYRYEYGDPYNPIVAGLCSFFIPGLGQMISGEIGRGFGWLGGVVGSYIVFGTGMNIAIYSYNSYYSNDSSIGTILILAGLTSAITLNILSIVDAVKVAKIKNMYERDVRSMSAINVSLSPYVECINIAGQRVTPVGLSLKVSL